MHSLNGYGKTTQVDVIWKDHSGWCDMGRPLRSMWYGKTIQVASKQAYAYSSFSMIVVQVIPNGVGKVTRLHNAKDLKSLTVVMHLLGFFAGADTLADYSWFFESVICTLYLRVGLLDM